MNCKCLYILCDCVLFSVFLKITLQNCNVGDSPTFNTFICARVYYLYTFLVLLLECNEKTCIYNRMGFFLYKIHMIKILSANNRFCEEKKTKNNRFCEKKPIEL